MTLLAVFFFLFSLLRELRGNMHSSDLEHGSWWFSSLEHPHRS